MPEVIANAEEVTPLWLTERLRANGHLRRGGVSGVRVKSSRTLPVSVISRLEVEYEPGAGPEAPRNLFLKVSNPDFVNEPRESPPEEIVFYSSVAPEMPDPPVPRFYDAGFSRETGRSHLLLEDLSVTHRHAPDPLAPPRASCEAAVDCLAGVHAHWWEHARLGAGVGRLLDDAGVRGLAEATAARYETFAGSLGGRLPRAWRETFERVIATFPRPWARLTSARGLTLTHGDAHTLNFLFPRGRGAGRTYLVDWQLWHVHIGPRDLAYMMTLFWASERRARMEEPLLRRYHRGLLAGGVEGYGWDDCLKDYRWSAVRNVFIPLLHWSRGWDEDFWRPQLEKAMHAYDDLRCAELVEGAA